MHSGTQNAAGCSLSFLSFCIFYTAVDYENTFKDILSVILILTVTENKDQCVLE